MKKAVGMIQIFLGIAMIVLGVFAVIDSTISIGGKSVTLELGLYTLIGFAICGVAMILNGIALRSKSEVVVLNKPEPVRPKPVDMAAVKEAKRRYEESMKKNQGE